MSPEIAYVLAVVLIAVVLFVTGWVRYDVVALLVLLALTVPNLVDRRVALAGFGNPAVITIASVLVLSGGLQRTGLADIVGRQVLRIAGERPVTLMAVMMVTAGLLSGFMNNIAVTALMLPAVLEMARRTQVAPSKLLMPLAFGSLLGGLTTLIGTAPNILLSESLAMAGEAPFKLFDFTPIGLIALLAGIVYMMSIGRRLLPDRGTGRESPDVDLSRVYDLPSTLFTVEIPTSSALHGKPLLESRLGAALGLSVLAIEREGRRIPAPPPGHALRTGDRLFIHGSTSPLNSIRGWKHLERESPDLPSARDLVRDHAMAEATLAPESRLAGKTLREYDFRGQLGLTVIAIARGGEVRRTRLADMRLQPDDVLIVVGPIGRLEDQQTKSVSRFTPLSLTDLARKYRIQDRLLAITVPDGSELDGLTLAETRLGDAFGLAVLEISNQGSRLLPGGDTRVRAGDTLLISGRSEDVEILEALQDLEIREDAAGFDALESDEVGLSEITLSPRSRLVDKTLMELFFREKYNLTVLSVWRGDRAYHSNVEIRNMKLRLGDALLVYGRRDKLALLARDRDFLVLTSEGREIYRAERAPLASLIMAGVVLSVALGLLPIYIAAPTGAVLMVLTGVVTLEEAYRFIDWRVLMLVAGMLSLGMALEATGAAAIIAERIIGGVAGAGPLALIGALFLFTAICAQMMPTTAVAVLVAPIALSTAAQLGLSPQAVMMVVAVGASSAFMSPVGHPVNLLVMGLGGYRFTDYSKAGFPLVIVMLLIALFVVPVFWPLTG